MDTMTFTPQPRLIAEELAPLLEDPNEDPNELSQLIELAQAASEAQRRLDSGELTPDEQAIARDTIQRGRAARSQIVEANRGLVWHVARRFPRHAMAGMDLDDLVQAGFLGLLRAIDGFDPSRGVQFSTYAVPWIRQSIRRAMENHGASIRLPVHVQEDMAAMARAQETLRQRLGHEPDVAAISAEANLSSRRVQRLLRVSGDPVSLATPIGGNARRDEDQRQLADTIPDVSVDPVADALAIVEREAIERLFAAALDPREQLVLRLLFGFDGEPMTLADVSQRIGRTRERVRQIKERALAKLRRHPDLRLIAPDPE